MATLNITPEQPLLTQFVSNQVTVEGRESIVYDISINGISFSSVGYIDLLGTIFFEESISKIDIIEFQVINKDIVNDNLFLEGNKVKLIIGYEDIGIRIIDNFFITKVDYIFTERGSFVKVTAMGSEILLSQKEKRRVFKGSITHSDIANQIAFENGFDSSFTIDDSIEVYDQIYQQNTSDYNFLKSLAKINGFVFYVQDQELHFHEIKNSVSDRFNTNLIVSYRNEGPPIIKEARVTILGYGKHLNTFDHDIDAQSGTQFRLESDDEFQSQTFEDLEDQELLNRKIADFGFKREDFSTDFTLTEKITEIQKYLNSQKFFGDFLVKLQIKCIGVEKLSSGKLVKIGGIGRFDGTYYITKACHSFKSDILSGQTQAYSTTIECYKKFTFETNPFTPIFLYFNEYIFLKI